MASFINTSEEQTLKNNTSKEAVIMNDFEASALQELSSTDEHLCLLSKVKPVDSVEDVDYYMPESRHAGTQTDEAYDNERHSFEIYDADTNYFMGIVTKEQLVEMIRNDALPDDDASKKSLDFDERSRTFIFSNNVSKSEIPSLPNKTKSFKQMSRTKKVSTLTGSPHPNNVIACKTNFKGSSLPDKATSYKDPLQPEEENGALESLTLSNIVKENAQDTLPNETSPFKKSLDFDETLNSTKSVIPNKASKSKRKSRSKKATKSIASSLSNNFLSFEESSNLKGSSQLDNVSMLDEPKAKTENDILLDETSKSKRNSRSKKASKSTAFSLTKNFLAFEESLNLKGSSQLANVSTLDEPKAKIENDILLDETSKSKRNSLSKKASKLTVSSHSNNFLAFEESSNLKGSSQLADVSTLDEPKTKIENDILLNETSKSKRNSRSKKASKSTVSSHSNNFLAFEESSNLKGSSQLANVSTLDEPKAKIENDILLDETSKSERNSRSKKASKSKVSSHSNNFLAFEELSNLKGSSKLADDEPKAKIEIDILLDETSKSKRNSLSKKASKSTVSSHSNNFSAFEESSNLKGSSQLADVSTLDEPKTKIENDIILDETSKSKRNSRSKKASKSTVSSHSNNFLAFEELSNLKGSSKLADDEPKAKIEIDILLDETSKSKRNSLSKKASKSTVSSHSNNFSAFEESSNLKGSSQLADVSTLDEPKTKIENDILLNETSKSIRNSRSKKASKSTAASLFNNFLAFESSNLKGSLQLANVSTLDEPKAKIENDILLDETSKSKRNSLSKKALKSTVSSLSNNFLAFEESSNLKGSSQLANVATLDEPKAKIENDKIPDETSTSKKSSDFYETSNLKKSLFPNKAVELKASSLATKTTKSRRKSHTKKASKSTASSLPNNFVAFEEYSNFKESLQLDKVSTLKESKVEKENDNEAGSGKFNILNDNIKLEKDCDVINTAPGTQSSPKVDGNKLETPQSLQASATLSPGTSNMASTLEEIITGIAFKNLPRCIGARISESTQRKRPQLKQVDMVDIVKDNKKEPPYIPECETHMYNTENLNGCFNFVGYEDNLNPTCLSKPHSAIETIDRLENILEMVLTFGFNKTDEVEDQFGSKNLAAPVVNSMGLIRKALEPIKSYIKSAEDTEFYRPFMNTVNNSISPAFYHLNDMKLTLESPETKNFTQLKLEKKTPDSTNDRDDKIMVSSVEIQNTCNIPNPEKSTSNQPNQIICHPNQGHNQVFSQEICTPIILPSKPTFQPIEPYHLLNDYQCMPYTTFTKFPWIPKGQSGINSLQSPKQGIILPNQNVENNISESENQHQSSVLRMQVLSDSAMVYHNPIVIYRPALVNPLGIIELHFKHNIQVILTADLSVLVINKADKMAAAFSSDGYMAGLKFLYGECSVKGKTVKFASTNKNLEIQIRANFCEKGITFRGERSSNCYIITEAGLKMSNSIFSVLDKDFFGQIIYSSGKYGPAYVEECNELINCGKNEVHSDGSIYWYFRDMKIFQNARGTVTIYKNNFTHSICMSPFHQVQNSYFDYMHMYAGRVKIPGIQFESSVTADEKHKLFIKQGRKKEIFSNNEKFSVRNDSQYAGLNVDTHEISSPLKQDQ